MNKRYGPRLAQVFALCASSTLSPTSLSAALPLPADKTVSMAQMSVLSPLNETLQVRSVLTPPPAWLGIHRAGVARKSSRRKWSTDLTLIISISGPVPLPRSMLCHAVGPALAYVTATRTRAAEKHCAVTRRARRAENTSVPRAWTRALNNDLLQAASRQFSLARLRWSAHRRARTGRAGSRAGVAGS